MTALAPDSLDVVVLGAGPAGAMAALRVARLGAKTALVTRDEVAGWPRTTGPCPSEPSPKPLD